MTDARQSAVGTGGSCCDFESLSCYADGELDSGAAAVVAQHLSDCPRCATLATRLRERFEADDARRDGGLGGSGCCDEEHLILYAAGRLPDAERAALAAHLAGCDACVSAVAVLHRHLAVLPTVGAPVPADIQRRAQVAFVGTAPDPLPQPAQAPRAEPRPVERLHRIRALLRLPVLVPVAMAAGALLTVIVQPGWVGRTASGERSRAVAPATTTLRVTAVEATVRSRPSMQSEVMGSVHRGSMIEIAGEERDWYAVRLDGGRSGWVEREAFE